LRRFGGSFRAKGVLVHQELRCYQGYSQPSLGVLGGTLAKVWGQLSGERHPRPPRIALLPGLFTTFARRSGGNPCEGLEAAFRRKASSSTRNCAVTRAIHNLRKGRCHLLPAVRSPACPPPSIGCPARPAGPGPTGPTASPPCTGCPAR